MKYIIDIDNTICVKPDNTQYNQVVPLWNRIEKINKLFDNGHEIVYWTSRGSTSGIDWTGLTKTQLNEWGCKYTSFSCGKPSYDVWLDDRAFDINKFFGEIDEIY